MNVKEALDYLTAYFREVEDETASIAYTRLLGYIVSLGGLVWIPVENRLPTNSKPVLCKVQLHGKHPAIAHFEAAYHEKGTYFKWIDWCGDTDIEQEGNVDWTVISWMKIPPAEKESKEPPLPTEFIDHEYPMKCGADIKKHKDKEPSFWERFKARRCEKKLLRIARKFPTF